MSDKLTEKEIKLLLSLKNQGDHEYTIFDSKSDEHLSLLDRKLISKAGNGLDVPAKEVLKAQNPNDERLLTYPRIKITSKGKRELAISVQSTKNMNKETLWNPLIVGIVCLVLGLILGHFIS